MLKRSVSPTALLLAPLALFLTTAPAIAAPVPGSLVAQAYGQSTGTPRIDSFSVGPIDALEPGSELVFSLEGTPQARATFNITGIATNLPMREVEPGYYEGRYTLRRSDRITATTSVRANLQVGRRTASARLEQQLIAQGGQDNQTTSINRFIAAPVDRVGPGSELVFTLEGTPRGEASFNIAGVARRVPMREVSPGIYEGRYTLRNQDVIQPNTNISAVLRAGNQTVRSRLDQPLVASGSGSYNPGNLGNPGYGTGTNTRLDLQILSPSNNTQVGGDAPIEVRGRTAANATVAVQVQANTSVAGLFGLNRNIFNQTLRTDSQGNFNFSFQPTVRTPGTRYEVNLNASNGVENDSETLVLIQR